MHLNALYRAAEAGKRSLVECIGALSSAARTNRLAIPIRYWRLRQARQHLDAAKDHLVIVRDNVSLVAALGEHREIDSSGGYAVADLLTGGLLAKLMDVDIETRIDRCRSDVEALLAQVGELMLRMRKAGAVS
jgi:hypothetical protein